MVGVVGFEPTTLTPQRSSHLSKLGHLQIRTTAQSREEPQIPANLLQVVRLVGCGPGGRNRVVPGAPLFPQPPRLLAPRVGGLMSRHRLGTSAKADLQNPGQWESPEATSEGLYYLGSSPMRWNAQGPRWSTTAGPSGPRGKRHSVNSAGTETVEEGLGTTISTQCGRPRDFIAASPGSGNLVSRPASIHCS